MEINLKHALLDLLVELEIQIFELVTRRSK